MFKRMCAILFCITLMTPFAVYAADELYVGGDSIGIEVHYDGIMVTGTYAITIDGELYDPKDHTVKQGDIIKRVNGIPIATMKDLYNEVSKYQELVNEVPIMIQRNHEEMFLSLKTLYSIAEKSFQSGLYVKDKIVGVGTITFYNPENNTFGALGHEIMDTDLKEIAEIANGEVYRAEVSSISKAQPNIAGEKHASINYEQQLGTIIENTNIGIYGHYEKLGNEALLLPWAKKEEIHTGYAQIYTVLSGDTIQSFDIEITNLHKQEESSIKGIEFTVTDPTLLAATNGIIQGMSGSPIVQNGKIIGAITHVITAEPTTGYGVYIEWMLKEANSLQS